jgi:phosphatidylglycerophosphatase A
MTVLSRWIATFFGIGYFPLAPATLGSAVAIIIFSLLPRLGILALGIGLPIMFFIGVWAATQAEKQLGYDAHPIIIDEVVAQWIILALIPRGWLPYVCAFFLFRVFDIWKPFPIFLSQKLPGGWGIMIDDLLAAIYSVIVIHIGIAVLKVG